MTTTGREPRRLMPGGLLTIAAILVLSAPVLAMGWPLIPPSTGWQLIPVALGMLVLAGACAAGAWHWKRRTAQDDLLVTRTPWVLAALAIPAGFRLASLISPDRGGVRLLEALAYVGAVGAASALLPQLWRSRWLTATRILVLVQAAVLAIAVHRYGDYIDVHVFIHNSTSALLHGHNPYGITFPDIYPPFLSLLYYGPGVVHAGVITYGFPYPPISVLWAVPSYLLGDVRYAGILALASLAWTLSGPSANRRSRTIALLFLLAPSAVDVVLGAWTETTVVALLGFAVWAITTRRLNTAAVFVGLLFVSKQYMVVALPCLWLLRPMITRRHVLIAGGGAGAVTLPFVLIDPLAFWHSVIHFQLIQPFRPDSLSALAYSVNHWSWPPESVFSWLPIVAGLLVAGVFSASAKPGAAQFATGVGLAMLTTVLLSKQAFINYYFLVGGSLLIAAWAAEHEAPQMRLGTDATGSRSAVEAVAPA